MMCYIAKGVVWEVGYKHWNNHGEGWATLVVGSLNKSPELIGGLYVAEGISTHLMGKPTTYVILWALVAG